jgi:hypothetical protein
MTKQAMTEFLEAVRTDEEIARGLIAAVGLNPEMQAAEAFAVYAREQGYPVTPEDVEQLRETHAAEPMISIDQLDKITRTP